MSIYGKKVVAVLDTESTFGVKFQKLVDDVKALMTRSSDAPELVDADNDQLAEQAGVKKGYLYRTGNIVKIRVT